jgi:hypothetical protein
MTFWTFEARQGLFACPDHLRTYKAQKEWLAQRKVELNFPENPLHFSHSKKGPKTFWAVIDLAALYDAKCTLGPGTADAEWLAWEANRYEQALRAEGSALLVEEAWAVACAAIGTDRMELAGAMYVSSLRQARHKLKEHQRLAGLKPEEATAQTQRFVYGESYFSSDDWGLSEEYRRQRQRFCFRRFRLVKETKLFIFCDLRNSEDIDRNGVVDEECTRFQHAHRDVSLTRIRKDLWDTPQLNWRGEPEEGASRYISNSPWGVRWLWVSFEALVEETDRRTRGFLQGLDSIDPNGGTWLRVLGLESHEDEVSGISKAELQRAYRKAVMRAHPDKGGSAEEFHQVQEAYEVAQRLLAGVW